MFTAKHDLRPLAIAAVALMVQSAHASNLLTLQFSGTLVGSGGLGPYGLLSGSNPFYFQATFDADPSANTFSGSPGMGRYPITSMKFVFPGIANFDVILDLPDHVVLTDPSAGPSFGYTVGFAENGDHELQDVLGLRSSFASTSSVFDAHAPTPTVFSGFLADKSRTADTIPVRTPTGSRDYLELPADALTGPTAAFITAVPEPETCSLVAGSILLAFAGWRCRR